MRFGRWVFAVLFVLVSCSRNDIAGPVPRVPDATGRIAFEISDRSLSDLAAGALEITLARIQTDTLVLDVRYGGGCADHAFVLVASSAFAESFPVQSFMRLSHDARGDLCKALVSRRDARAAGPPSVQPDAGRLGDRAETRDLRLDVIGELLR